jgi:predicted tellurium resistance membrane protein TerC
MIPNILLPRYFKWIGFTIYVITFYLGIKYPYPMDDVEHIGGLLIQCFIFLGLFFMISARLKVEDEMTQHIRLVSLQWSIVLFIGLRLVLKSLAFYHKDPLLLPNIQTNMMLLIYLILFYTQVYAIPFLKTILNKDNEE